MSIDSGYYPAQAKLILDPTGYTTGGTDLGKVQSVHTASIIPQFEFLTEHKRGNQTVDARMTGLAATYLIHMIDWSTNMMDVLFNGMHTTDKWQGPNGYNLGDIMGSSYTNELLIRPVDDDDAGDATKPMLYIPRAICVSAFNATWDRRLPHTAGWVIQIMALFDSTLGALVAYGDSADFPSL